MASFEQDLDDDEEEEEEEDEYVSGPPQPQEEWTCKKCTLVNSGRVKACIVCGGSKLRSISSVEDMTLRKGEFWSCAQCTLKNSLSTNCCIACKAMRQIPVISGQQTNFRPYTSTPGSGSNAKSYHNRQVLSSSIPAASSPTSTQSPSLMPATNRVSRSPSPRHDKGSSGAIPKVSSLIPLFYLNLENFSFSFVSASQYRCIYSTKIES